MRKWAAVLAAVLVLGVVNWLVLRNEQLLREGEVFYLELAPVDPRALLQGDYMALNYAVAGALSGSTNSSAAREGWALLSLDARRIASQPREVAAGTPAGANQVLVPFRSQGWRVSVLSNAYFFEEGQAARYQNARYGKFRSNGDGRALLVSLCDEQLKPL